MPIHSTQLLLMPLSRAKVHEGQASGMRSCTTKSQSCVMNHDSKYDTVQKILNVSLEEQMRSGLTEVSASLLKSKVTNYVVNCDGNHQKTRQESS